MERKSRGLQDPTKKASNAYEKPTNPSPPSEPDGQLKSAIALLKSQNNRSHNLINDIEAILNELGNYSNSDVAGEVECAKEPYDLLAKLASELEVKHFINERLDRIRVFLINSI